MKTKPKAAKGNIIISITFTLFISLLALCIMTFHLTHVKIVKARTTHAKETEKLYRDLVYYIHHFREAIFNEEMRNFGQPEVEFFNADYFPDTLTGSGQLITHGFSSIDYPRPGYKKTRVNAALSAASGSGGHPYRLNSEIIIDILSGKVPLTEIPVFIDKNAESPPETFIEQNRIVNNSGQKPVVDDIETEIDISRFLLESLKVSGTLLSWRTIREKLGLPPSDEPIPDGLYPSVEENIVKALVIQGNVQRMIFSVDSSSRVQAVRIIKEASPYEIQYKPGENYFISPDVTIPPDALFKEKIIVNGDILSIEQVGEAAFIENSRITLLVSGTAVIRTNLESENQHLAINRLALTNLTVGCGKAGLLNGGDDQAGILVDTGAPANLHVSMIIDGKFTNNSPSAAITGSLYCTDLENNGTVEINHGQSSLTSTDGNYFRTVDFKYISQFLISFIEEVSDEY